MIRTPSPKTLAKYGLTELDFARLLEDQKGVCFVCQKVPSTGRICIDHEHVKNWKQLPPDRRKLYVRGLLCWWCNHAYLGRGITADRSRRVTQYLELYQSRRPKDS